MQKDYIEHSRANRKRVIVPAIRITSTGYAIFNAALIKAVGNLPETFSIKMRYYEAEKKIAISITRGDIKNNPYVKLKSTLCIRAFLDKVFAKIDSDKFYIASKVIESPVEEIWSISLEDKQS
jgi:hypothetical protein